MSGAIEAGNLANASVSLSRFNRGQAGKVFQEVRETGLKIVLKNNRPECILLSPLAFEAIKEALENYRLLIETEERLKGSCEADFVSAEEAMKELGITEADLETTSNK